MAIDVAPWTTERKARPSAAASQSVNDLDSYTSIVRDAPSNAGCRFVPREPKPFDPPQAFDLPSIYEIHTGEVAPLYFDSCDGACYPLSCLLVH